MSEGYYRLRIVPATLKASNEYVERLHRHHKRVQGCKFCISVEKLVPPEEIYAGKHTGLWDSLLAFDSAVQAAWCAETANRPELWTPENPAFDQCYVTSLVLQDVFGGRLLRRQLPDDSHYSVLLDDGREIDLTISQFPRERWDEIRSLPTEFRDRPADGDMQLQTHVRYVKLKNRLSQWQQCGVAIVGRPVSRVLNSDVTVAEVNRLCTDGTRNACSALYAASARIWKEMGGTRLITYILSTESGTSLKAAGWKKVMETRDRPQGWSTPSRLRTSGPQVPKQRWETQLRGQQYSGTA